MPYIDYDDSQLPEDELEEHMLATAADNAREADNARRRMVELHTDSFMGAIGGGWNPEQFKGSPFWVLP